MTKLTLTIQPSVPLEADVITPDRFVGKSHAEIAALPVQYGNQKAALGEFFAVEGDGAAEIEVAGELARVKLIGAGMTQGQITIRGDAGMHLGAQMRGGRIEVHGSAGDWAGAEMQGGQLFIHGNAGHGLGSAYRGSPKGMKGGLIVVDGNAGNEIGSAMRRGLIVVRGDTGDFTGSFMIAGTILAFGRLGPRPGAGLKRGTIVTWQPAKLLPTFRYACTYRPTFMGLLMRELASQGVVLPTDHADGRYRRYCGELTALGKGEILEQVAPTLTIQHLLAQVNEHNLHGEVDTGPAMGKEIW
jgi:formylmethanofuran dehydrogenase subunit C